MFSLLKFSRSNQPTAVRATPTVESNPVLSISHAAINLRRALKKKDADQVEIIIILTCCSNTQRHEIVKTYYAEFGRNLEKDMRRRLCGTLESLLVGLIYPPVDYFARHLNKALKGMYPNDNTIIEILVTLTYAEIQGVAESYEKAFHRPLLDHLRSKTSGAFKTLLLSIVQAPRAPEEDISSNKSQELAKRIQFAAEVRRDTVIDEMVRIFGRENFNTLHRLVEDYNAVTGEVIDNVVKRELSGNLLKLTMAIVEYARNPFAYFAKQLHRAIEVANVDDQTLIRIIITRSEIDLGSIKKEYKKLYNKTLRSEIKTSLPTEELD